MSVFSEKLQEYIEKKALSNSKIADLSGINRTVFHRYLKGERRPTDDALERLSDLESMPSLQVLKAWRMRDDYGNEEILEAGTEHLKEKYKKLFKDGRLHISNIIGNAKEYELDFLGVVKAGLPLEVLEEKPEKMRLFLQEKPKAKSFILQVSGDSMAPKVQDGSFIILSELETKVKDGTLVVVQTTDYETTLKYILNASHTSYLIPENGHYDIIEFNHESIHKIWRVLQIIQPLPTANKEVLEEFKNDIRLKTYTKQ